MNTYPDIRLDKITQSLQDQILAVSDKVRHEDRLSTASAILDALAVGVIVTNQAGLITYVNTRAEELLERKRRQLHGEAALSVKFFGPDIIKAQKARGKLLKNDHWEGQLNIFTPRGERKTIQYYASVIRNGEGDLMYALASMTAVYEHQQSSQLEEEFKVQQLQELQAQTDAVLQNTTNPVWFVDQNARLIKYNEVFAASVKKQLGISLKPGMKFEQLLPSSYHQRWRQLHAKAREGKPITCKESLLLGGKKVLYLVSARPGRDVSGKVNSICFASQRQGQESPYDQLMRQEIYEDGRDDERRRIGMELHDGVGQRITALQMRLNVLIARQQNNPESLQQIREEVASIQDEIRRISHNMLPLPLEQHGIEESLRRLLRNTGKPGEASISYRVDLSQEKYDKDIEKNLYYIVQELLQNTVKHAKNQKAFLNISEESGLLNVIYRNNISFADRGDHNKHSGRGLMSIRERVNALGGALQVENNRKTGFQVNIKLHV